VTKMAVGGMMDGLDVEEITGLNKVPPGTWMVDRIPFRNSAGIYRAFQLPARSSG